jgi:GT2 family glycosyltransferase
MSRDEIRWSVHIVANDPSGSLPDALRALEATSPQPDSVVVVDNAPAGRPRPEVSWSRVRWLRNPRSQEVGRCHNLAIEFAAHAAPAGSETVILVITPDVIVGTDMFTSLKRVFMADTQIASVGPILRRAHVIGSLDGERRELEFTNVVDAAGVSVGRFGRIKPVARGLTSDALTEMRPPFGPSPACVAFRLSALKSLSSSGPWFRESGTWEKIATRLFQGLKAAGYSLAVAKETVAWRLASRDV